MNRITEKLVRVFKELMGETTAPYVRFEKTGKFRIVEYKRIYGGDLYYKIEEQIGLGPNEYWEEVLGSTRYESFEDDLEKMKQFLHALIDQRREEEKNLKHREVVYTLEEEDVP